MQRKMDQVFEIQSPSDAGPPLVSTHTRSGKAGMLVPGKLGLGFLVFSKTLLQIRGPPYILYRGRLTETLKAQSPFVNRPVVSIDTLLLSIDTHMALCRSAQHLCRSTPPLFHLILSRRLSV